MKLIAVILIFTGMVSALYNVSEMVVRGHQEEITDSPYYVQVGFYKDSIECGGSIISMVNVITAAHCVLGDDKDGYFPIPQVHVRAGSDKLKAGRRIDVHEYVIHPKCFLYSYNFDLIVFDLAVLTLSKPLVYSRAIKPIALATRLPPFGTLLKLSGFGKTELTNQPGHLQAALLPLRKQKDCDFNKNYTTGVLCVGFGNFIGPAPCMGDSGGPLAWGHHLLGVVSFSDAICAKKAAGFISIPTAMDWILAETTIDPRKDKLVH